MNHETIPPQFRLSTYDYHLAPDRIAHSPSERRDESRLMVIDRASGAIRHHVFSELPGLLRATDVLVVNETKVVPATLTGTKPSGGRVELLVLDPAQCRVEESDSEGAVRICLYRASKGLRPGTPIDVAPGVTLIAEHAVAGRVNIRFPVGEGDFLAFLDQHGKTPLPPYISRECRDPLRDKQRYQTVYCRTAGSVAAPTAGLHFTEELMGTVERRGIDIVKVILHVGPGTFVPVRDEDVRRHRMECESFELSQSAAETLQGALNAGRRVVAVGTTSVRTLESALSGNGAFVRGNGKTALFITPGYRFRAVGSLVTNFHLPRSTLLMLVCAFGGTDLMLRAYREAVEAGYRFYSFGDSCLII